MYADNYTYQNTVYGGAKWSFVLVDVKTNAIHHFDVKSKKENGKQFARIVAKEGIHKLPYKCTISTDNCGSMQHVIAAAIRLGINYEPTPPYEPNCNPAELAIRHTVDGARVHLAHAALDDFYINLAMQHYCYVHYRMASTASRGGITPHEAIKSVIPDCSHLVPFGTRVFANMTKEKRNAKKQAARKKQVSYDTSKTSEEGIMVGFHTIHSTTYKVLTVDKQIIHSRSCTFDHAAPPGLTRAQVRTSDSDPVDAVQDVIQDTTALRRLAELNASAEPSEEARNNENIGNTTRNNEKTVRFNPTDSDCDPTDSDCNDIPAGEGENAVLRTPKRKTKTQVFEPGEAPEMPDVQVDINPLREQVSLPDTVKRNTGLDGNHFSQPITETRERKQTEFFHSNKSAHYMSSIRHMTYGGMPTPKANKAAAQTAKANLAQLYAECAATAHLAMTDMSWVNALKSDDRQLVIDAYNKEMSSLLDTILIAIPEGHPERAAAEKLATPGRALLDFKRSGVYKARIVKQGFKEDKVANDGVDFNYYAHVCEMTSVRCCTLRPNRGSRRLCQVDISTAFLQSNKYAEDEPPKYLVFKNPLTGNKEYYRQLGPIYGENSAPVRWLNTIVPWLTGDERNNKGEVDIESDGHVFEQGDNEPCVFYHAGRDLLVLLYVDDILCDGAEEDCQWFIEKLAERFKCKDAEWLSMENQLDHLGMIIAMDDQNIYMSMEAYIERMLDVLDMRDSKATRTPINGPIIDTTPITHEQTKWCYKALGCIGWLVNTVRCDGKYAHSRIAQHLASPNKGMYDAVKYLVRYFKGTKALCIYQPLHGNADGWTYYCDSDFAGNAEVQNKRRSQSGYIAFNGTAPILWGSKPSSVLFDEADIVQTVSAHPRIGGTHADMSSGASEVYACANSTLDFMHLGYVVDEMNMDQPQVIELQVDNTTAEAFMNNSVKKSKLKHIDCRQEWVKTIRDKDIVTPVHVHTDLNTADFFTKILSPAKFLDIRDRFMVQYSVLK